MFIELDEISQRDREFDLLGTERIQPQIVFKLSDQNGEAKGVESRIQQGQIVGEGTNAAVLPDRDFLHFRQNG